MNSPRYARLVAEVFKQRELRAGDVAPRSNRDEEIALVEQTIERRRRRIAQLRVAAASVAALLAITAVGTWRATRGGPSFVPAAVRVAESKEAAEVPIDIAIASGRGAIVATPGSSTPAVAGSSLHAGSRLIVDPGAGATLSLSTGTHLEVEPGSQLSVIEDNHAQIFALNAGSLRADVAKLGKDERFIVRTADAEVEVRGTSFLVDVVTPDPACGAGTTTRVTVLEGVVMVRAGGQEEAIARGEHWPRACSTAPALTASAHVAVKRSAKADLRPTTSAPAARRSASEPLAPAAKSPIHAPSLAHGLSTTHLPSSSLAEENNLFAEGMLARRNGNVPLAIEKMDYFLEKYPASHLAENAAAERMRLLRGGDAARAAIAARHYLQRYPSGFAHEEAEAILAATP